jgi:hypothetical protein
MWILLLSACDLSFSNKSDALYDSRQGTFKVVSAMYLEAEISVVDNAVSFCHKCTIFLHDACEDWGVLSFRLMSLEISVLFLQVPFHCRVYIAINFDTP